MTVHGGLNADNIKVFQVQIAAVQVESADATLRLHVLEVEDGSLARVSSKNGACVSRTCLIDIEHEAVTASAAAWCHYLSLVDNVCTSAKICGVASRHRAVRLAECLKWCFLAAAAAVIAVRGNIINLRSCKECCRA